MSSSIKATILHNLIFFADCNNLRKFAEVPFHAIDSLNNNNYLLPGSMSPWLSLRNLLSQNFLQVRGCCTQVGEGETWVIYSKVHSWKYNLHPKEASYWQSIQYIIMEDLQLIFLFSCYAMSVTFLDSSSPHHKSPYHYTSTNPSSPFVNIFLLCLCFYKFSITLSAPFFHWFHALPTTTKVITIFLSSIFFFLQWVSDSFLQVYF